MDASRKGRFRRSRIPALAAAMALAAFGEAAAQAQDCRQRDVEPCTDAAPGVYFETPAGTVLKTRAENAFVSVTDDFGVGSHAVTVNGRALAPASVSWVTPGKAAQLTLQPFNGTADTVAEVVATVTDDAGKVTTARATYLYRPDPVPSLARVAPAVSAPAHHPGFRDVTLGGSSLGYATPAYVSLGEGRSLSLSYASGQGSPFGYVQVTAYDASTERPATISLLVRDPATGVVIAPETFYAAGAGENVLAAAWDAGTRATGAYDYEAVVRSRWANGQVLETSIPVRVLILNHASSPAGRGWSIAGVQRLHADARGVLVDNGDGTAAFFTRPAGCASPCVNTSYAAPEGDFSQLTWNGAQWVRRWLDGSAGTFDATGLMLSLDDALGRRTTLSYTAGRLDRVTDPAGKAIVLGYDAAGRLSTATDPGGRVTRFVVGAAGTLSSVQDPDGRTALALSYDASGRLGEWLDRNGSRWVLAYDAARTLASITAPEISPGVRPVTQFRSPMRAALAEAGTGTPAAPAPRVLSGAVRARVTDPRGSQTLATLDRYGNPTRVDLPLGGWAETGYDAHGRPVRATDSDGAMVDWAWNAGGTLARSYDWRAKSEVSIQYDAVHPALPARVTRDGFSTYYAYNADRTLREQRQGWEGARPYAYTYEPRFKRMQSVLAPDSTRTTAYYDGTAWANTDSVKVTSRDTLFTGLPRVSTSRYTYDGFGRTETRADSYAGVVRSQYDLLNRVTSVTDPMGYVTRFAFQEDPLRPYTRLTDAAGKVFTTTYNPLGLALSEQDALGTRTFTYHADGSVASATNRRGQTVTAAYDARGRILARTEPGGAATTWSYDDPGGRWVTVANAEATETTFFGPAGTVDSTRTVMGGRTYLLKSSHDAQGRRTRVDLLRPFARTVEYGFSPGGALESVRDLSGALTYVAHDALRRPVSLMLPGATQNVTYNDRSLPSRFSWDDPGQLQAFGAAYQFDLAGRVIEKSGLLPHYFADPSAETTGRRFGYDGGGRLVATADSRYWRESACPPYVEVCEQDTIELREEPLASTQLGYDGVGNRTDRGAVVAAGSNRYTAFDGHTLWYDADGNLVRKAGPVVGDQSFTWDALGRLASVTTNGATVSYGYSGSGIRVRRTAGAAVTRYLYDGDDLFMEVDGAGNPVREYTFYPGVDAPHSMRSAGSTYYYATDLLGNVAGLLDSDGQVVNRYGYSAFGEAESVAEAVANPLRFMGREQDPASGLYYVRARWYDAHQGRFVSEDPIGLAGGINVYAYAGNDPVNGRDPSGLAPPTIEECIKEQLLRNPKLSLEMAEAMCGGRGIALPGLVATAGWPFATPRESGESGNFGKRGVTGSGTRPSSGGGGATNKPTWNACMGNANNMALLTLGTITATGAGLLHFAAEGSAVQHNEMAVRLYAQYYSGSGMAALDAGIAHASKQVMLRTLAMRSGYVAVGVGGLIWGYQTGAGVMCGLDSSYYN